MGFEKINFFYYIYMNDSESISSIYDSSNMKGFNANKNLKNGSSI